MCKSLGVSRAGFYAWLERPPSARAVENRALCEDIRVVFDESHQSYGSPRVYEEFRSAGKRIGRNRIARLMREAGLKAIVRRRFRTTTNSAHDLPVAENLLERCFESGRPNEAWVTDLTYVWTSEGWLYLAVVLDLFSRRIVGWSMARHMRTDLVLNALRMALGNRLPDKDLVHHSDRGSQYASFRYQELLERQGITCSMSRRGDCYDNAVVESFFGTLKTELIYRRSWPDRQAARSAIHDYIEVFYNRKRRHSTLGYRSPAEFEAHYYAAQAA